MSNSLAIATVTASLRNLLQSAFNVNAPDAIDGSDVSTVSPSDSTVAKKGANIFLYQVSPNSALRNQGLPTREGGGRGMAPAQIALDLHYLFSFYGNEAHWEPQRFLGVAVRTLNELPVLSRRVVAQTVQTVGSTQGFEFLVESDLAQGPELVRLTPSPISLEELSKLWSILLQTRYVLSVSYVASVVVISSERNGGGPAPAVLERRIFVNPARNISLARVVAADGSADILAGASVSVLGSGLLVDGLAVLLDGERSPSALQDQSDDRIQFVLPATLRAGAHGLQAAAFLGATNIARAESNLLAFLVRPQISGPITQSGVVTDPARSGTFKGILTVPVSPRVAATQRKLLLLIRKDAAPQAPPPVVVLELPPALPGAAGDTDSLDFAFGVLPAGLYLVRLRVDGAENPPGVLGDGTLGPELAIP